MVRKDWRRKGIFGGILEIQEIGEEGVSDGYARTITY
jgi:hypothetical protein